MDLIKSYDFFKPEMCKGRVHIIGCGSVGSTVAENLARFGIEDMVLYDFDIVEEHNLVNQMFTKEDVGRLKTEALADYVHRSVTSSWSTKDGRVTDLPGISSSAVTASNFDAQSLTQTKRTPTSRECSTSVPGSQMHSTTPLTGQTKSLSKIFTQAWTSPTRKHRKKHLCQPVEWL